MKVKRRERERNKLGGEKRGEVGRKQCRRGEKRKGKEINQR